MKEEMPLSESTRTKHIEEMCLLFMEEQQKSGLTPEDFYGIMEQAIKLNKADIQNG